MTATTALSSSNTARNRSCGLPPVGADIVVTSRDLRILVDQAAQPIASSDAYVVAGGCDVGSAGGWSLAGGAVRPVGVVVIGVFAEGVVEMPSAGDEDPVSALAPGTGDPPFADRVRGRRLDRRGDDRRAGRGEDGAERAGVLGIAVPDQELQGCRSVRRGPWACSGLAGASRRRPGGR